MKRTKSKINVTLTPKRCRPSQSSQESITSPCEGKSVSASKRSPKLPVSAKKFDAPILDLSAGAFNKENDDPNKRKLKTSRAIRSLASQFQMAANVTVRSSSKIKCPPVNRRSKSDTTQMSLKDYVTVFQTRRSLDLAQAKLHYGNLAQLGSDILELIFDKLSLVDLSSMSCSARQLQHLVIHYIKSLHFAKVVQSQLQPERIIHYWPGHFPIPIALTHVPSAEFGQLGALIKAATFNFRRREARTRIFSFIFDRLAPKKFFDCRPNEIAPVIDHASLALMHGWGRMIAVLTRNWSLSNLRQVVKEVQIRNGISLWIRYLFHELKSADIERPNTHQQEIIVMHMTVRYLRKLTYLRHLIRSQLLDAIQPPNIFPIDIPETDIEFMMRLNAIINDRSSQHERHISLSRKQVRPKPTFTSTGLAAFCTDAYDYGFVLTQIMKAIGPIQKENFELQGIFLNAMFAPLAAVNLPEQSNANAGTINNNEPVEDEDCNTTRINMRSLNDLKIPLNSEEIEYAELVPDFYSLTMLPVPSPADALRRLRSFAIALEALAVTTTSVQSRDAANMLRYMYKDADLFHLCEEVTTFPEPWTLDSFGSLLLMTNRVSRVLIEERVRLKYFDEVGALLAGINFLIYSWRNQGYIINDWAKSFQRLTLIALRACDSQDSCYKVKTSFETAIIQRLKEHNGTPHAWRREYEAAIFAQVLLRRTWQLGFGHPEETVAPRIDISNMPVEFVTFPTLQQQHLVD